jgi:hypothetical protein
VLNNNSILYSETELNKENIKISFSKDNLKENIKFNKLNNKLKEQILNQFNKFNVNLKMFNAYFICYNCGYNTNIEPGTVIYSNGLDIMRENSKENISLLCKDKTLPRTKDYICINKSCISHEKSNMNLKEAIIYRLKHPSYNINYVCTLCNSRW